MKKQVFKISFLILWLIILGFWWQNNRLYQINKTQENNVLAEFENFYTIKSKDTKNGWGTKALRHELKQEADTILYNNADVIGYQYEERTVVNVTALNKIYPLDITVTGNYNLNFNLNSFLINFKLTPFKATILGQKTNENTLKINASLENIIKKELIINNVNGPILSSILPVFLSQANLEVNKNYTISILSPFKRELVPIEIFVEALTSQYDRRRISYKPVYKLRINFNNEISYLWIDLNGQVIKEENSLKMLLEQVPTIEEAQKDFTLAPKSPLEQFKLNDLNTLLENKMETDKNLQDFLNPLETEITP